MSPIFLQPVGLWLLLLVPLLWFVPRRAPDWRHASIRSLVVILLVLALARPALLKNNTDGYQVIVWDRSESMIEDATPAVESILSELPKGSQIQLIALNGARQNAPAIAGADPINIGGSSLSTALARAAAVIPEGARGAVTVVSDGSATDPNWGEAVRQLADRKIPVHTIGAPPRRGDVYPVGIRILPPVRVGQTSKVIVDVIGDSQAVEVILSSGETVLASRTAKCSGRTAIELEFEPAEAGVLEVTASLKVSSNDDSDPSNNTFSSSLAVQEPIRALYLAERLTGAAGKMGKLLGRGVELTEPSSAQLEQLAKLPGGIAAYDLIMIDDRPADSIPLEVQQAIKKAVIEGGTGLYYAGGKSAFGTGGYFDTPIASILPVEMIQKEEKRDPSTTLVVIIDTSGSMSGERVQLAKECARLAIRRLLPHDKVGIVEFYGTKQWAAPIQSAANAIDIQRALNRMDAGGGTVILPAIEEAFYALQNVKTRYKHVLVLTDAGVEQGDFEGLMRRMAAKGINVSTVLVGGQAHSELLVNIANWGKGHFYAASNRFSIPEVLLKQPSTSKIPPYRPGVHPLTLGGTSGWWGDIPRPEQAQLAGYVETRLRPGAQSIIETSNERHPVMASWRFGLGRVTTLTTETVGAGTEPWVEWNGYGQWLLRALSRTSREHPQPFKYSIERDLNSARVIARRLTASGYLPQAERLRDEGDPEPLAFERRSPDVFTSTLLEDSDKPIRLLAGAVDWPGSLAHVASPAWLAAAPENNVDPARASDLSLLSSATGGTHLKLAERSGFDPVAGGSSTAVELLRLWPWCLLLALLGYFSDLLFRRWPSRRPV
ncbi:MAG: Ca-activated chloride channel family protein [Pseudoalteromonas tetraodonis]